MEQTAVEWLEDKVKDVLPFFKEEVEALYITYIEQAKEMEKHQIKDAFVGGLINFDNTDDYDSEQYFKERYGK
jgi:hypothetical protein